MNIYIGENIRRLRLSRQITQEQLSVAMGVSCAAVSKWERGETLPDISLLPMLAHYFSVSIDELIGYDAARIEEEIRHFLEEHGRLFRDGKGALAVNKKCSELWFCRGLSPEEKGEAALAVCAALESLGRTAFCGEADYFLSGFAAGMARKLQETKGHRAVVERLCGIREEAERRFREYSETDPAAKEILNYDFLEFP